MPSEFDESVAFANWLRSNGYRFTHVANESGLPPKVAMRIGQKKRLMGTSKGFPDYLIVLKRGSLLFVELKKERGAR